jgi:hypothetical protein
MDSLLSCHVVSPRLPLTTARIAFHVADSLGRLSSLLSLLQTSVVEHLQATEVRLFTTHGGVWELIGAQSGPRRRRPIAFGVQPLRVSVRSAMEHRTMKICARAAAAAMGSGVL